MIIAIEATDTRPIYLQIMDEVRRAVVLGTVKGDQSLPSVRQLAAELRLNPNTVQQAYRELEREGIVYVRRGLGTFVAPVESTRMERENLARTVAERALLEAYRHGLTGEDLLEAIRGATADEEEGEAS